MTVLTADTETRIAELSDSSFEAFCDDIAAMFDADVTCTRQDVGTGTVKDIQKHFKKLAAIHHVEATGFLQGTFPLLFDQGGLFTLSGVIVMLPERRIREEIKRGSIDDAENLTDAAREVGNLLVGSWDRVFREECEGHDHFLKTDTFIGKPWEDLDKTGLSADGEFIFVLYEMTVDSYPSFRCASVFPLSVLGGSTPEVAEAPPAEEPVAEPAAAPAPAAAPEPAAPAPAPQPAVEPAPAPPAAAQPEAPAPSAPAPQPAAPAEPVAVSEPAPPQDRPAETPEPAVAVSEPEPPEPKDNLPIDPDIRSTVEAVVGNVDEPVERTVSMPPKPVTPVSPPAQPAAKPEAGFINHMFDDIVGYSNHSGIADLLMTQAKDIMVPEVVWAESEDTVKDVVAKMQQHNTGYVLVGHDGVLEGLVSNSNILGAMSPYLRPMFAKWHRPEDDATLEIKIKWVMSRPVRTVMPETTLASMVESMRRYGGRCLPVVDKQAQVQGIITVFDIMLRVLSADESFSWNGQPPQAPPLLI